MMDDAARVMSDSKRKLKQLIKLKTDFGEEIKERDEQKALLTAAFEKRLATLAQNHKAALKKVGNSVITDEGDAYERVLPEYEKKFMEMATDFESARTKRKKELDSACSSVFRQIREYQQLIKNMRSEVAAAESEFSKKCAAITGTLESDAHGARFEQTMQRLFEKMKRQWVEMHWLNENRWDMKESACNLKHLLRKARMASEGVKMRMKIIKRERDQALKFEKEVARLRKQNPLRLYQERDMLRQELAVLLGYDMTAFMEQCKMEFQAGLAKRKERVASVEKEQSDELRALEERLAMKQKEKREESSEIEGMDPSVQALMDECRRLEAAAGDSGAVMMVCDTTLENAQTQLELTRKRIQEEREALIRQWQDQIHPESLAIEELRYNALQATMKEFLQTYPEMLGDYLIRFEEETRGIVDSLSAELEHAATSYIQERESVLQEISLANEKFVKDQQALNESRPISKSPEPELNQQRAEYREKFLINEMAISDLQKEVMKESTMLQAEAYKFGELERSHESKYIVQVEDLRKEQAREISRLRDIRVGMTGVLDERIEVLEMQRNAIAADSWGPEALEGRLSSLNSKLRISLGLLDVAKRTTAPRVERGLLARPAPRFSK